MMLYLTADCKDSPSMVKNRSLQIVAPIIEHVHLRVACSVDDTALCRYNAKVNYLFHLTDKTNGQGLGELAVCLRLFLA